MTFEETESLDDAAEKSDGYIAWFVSENDDGETFEQLRHGELPDAPDMVLILLSVVASDLREFKETLVE